MHLTKAEQLYLPFPLLAGCERTVNGSVKLKVNGKHAWITRSSELQPRSQEALLKNQRVAVNKLQ